jgi:hypothetical protein
MRSGELVPPLVEPWYLPFVIDQLLGQQPWRPDRFDRLRPRGTYPPTERRRQLRGPSPFAQYAVFTPIVPFESSPLGSKALVDLVTAGGGAGAALGSYVTGDPILLIVAAGGIIVCGAARGISDALRIGLRARLLELMGVDDPGKRARAG